MFNGGKILITSTNFFFEVKLFYVNFRAELRSSIQVRFGWNVMQKVDFLLTHKKSSDTMLNPEFNPNNYSLPDK